MYLSTFSASGAYRLTHPDASTETCYVQGSKYLRKPKIRKMLAARLADSQMSADELKQRLADIARGESKQALRALELIGKVHGIFIERRELDVKGTLSWKDLITGGENGTDGS